MAIYQFDSELITIIDHAAHLLKSGALAVAHFKPDIAGLVAEKYFC